MQTTSSNLSPDIPDQREHGLFRNTQLSITKNVKTEQTLFVHLDFITNDGLASLRCSFQFLFLYFGIKRHFITFCQIKK